MDITELIELIKQSAIDVINQTQPQSLPFFSGGDWIAVIVAVLATAASIYGIVSTNAQNREMNNTTNSINEKINDATNRINEEINQKIIDANMKLNEANIDANLTATARIEWIQNVRGVTTDLISACYSFLDIMSDETAIEWNMLSEKKEKIDKVVMQKDDRRRIAYEKKNLFTLYFGPDEDDCSAKGEKTESYLKNKTTNKGKNELLVSFVNGLFEKQLSTCDSNHTQIIKGADMLELIGSKKKAYDEAYKSLSELSEIMRIYLKIEWDRAKKRK